MLAWHDACSAPRTAVFLSPAPLLLPRISERHLSQVRAASRTQMSGAVSVHRHSLSTESLRLREHHAHEEETAAAMLQEAAQRESVLRADNRRLHNELADAKLAAKRTEEVHSLHPGVCVDGGCFRGLGAGGLG